MKSDTGMEGKSASSAEIEIKKKSDSFTSILREKKIKSYYNPQDLRSVDKHFICYINR